MLAMVQSAWCAPGCGGAAADGMDAGGAVKLSRCINALYVKGFNGALERALMMLLKDQGFNDALEGALMMLLKGL